MRRPFTTSIPVPPAHPHRLSRSHENPSNNPKSSLDMLLGTALKQAML